MAFEHQEGARICLACGIINPDFPRHSLNESFSGPVPVMERAPGLILGTFLRVVVHIAVTLHPEELEPIHHSRFSRRGRCLWLRSPVLNGREGLLEGLRTLVCREFNLGALVAPNDRVSCILSKGRVNVPSAHHASDCKLGKREGVGADEATVSYKLYPQDHEVVNVLQVIADLFLGQSRIAAANHHIPRGPFLDFAPQMFLKEKLTLAPADVGL